MAILKFRISFEEDDSIYRDISIYHKQFFLDLHKSILTAYEFDNKHEATFYRSNDNWQRGREISFEKYDKEYVVEPLLMHDTTIGSQIFNTTQKFVYHYDFNKNWIFQVALINVSKEDSNPDLFPVVVRKEGIAPSQYGTKGLMGNGKLTEVEEKYDLSNLAEGFGTKGTAGEDVSDDDLLGLNIETPTETDI
jgi:hypothetical protein